jgi:hypothetical protein
MLMEGDADGGRVEESSKPGEERVRFPVKKLYIAPFT